MRSERPERLGDVLEELRGAISAPERAAADDANAGPLTPDEAEAIARARARRDQIAWWDGARLPERYRRADLDDDLVPAPLRAWAQTLPHGRHRGSAILHGPPGSGKTASSCWAIRQVLRSPEWTLTAPRDVQVHMPRVALVRCSDLFALVFARGDAEAERLRVLRQLDYLVIDDLGMAYETEFPLGELDSLIDARWSADLPTLVTTNIYATASEGADSFEKRYPRAFSRLCDGIGPVRFPNRDLRRDQK